MLALPMPQHDPTGITYHAHIGALTTLTVYNLESVSRAAEELACICLDEAVTKGFRATT